MHQFVARIVAFDDGDRPVLPTVERLKLLDVSPTGMADTEDYLNDVCEQLVTDDGVRPRPEQYRLHVYDNATGQIRLHWRYTRTGR